MTFQVCFVSTAFTRQPIGLFSVSDIVLLNLDSNLNVTVEFELNQINTSTESGKVLTAMPD